MEAGRQIGGSWEAGREGAGRQLGGSSVSLTSLPHRPLLVALAL